MLIPPDYLTMRYNCVCALTVELEDYDAALDLLATIIDRMNAMLVTYLQLDPAIDPLRDMPRFERMLAGAKVRIEASGGVAEPPAASAGHT